MPGDPQAGGSKTAQLESVSMPRLLFALLRNRFTGTLVLAQAEPAGQRTIWVSGGMPLFTDWVSPPDVLGEVLVGQGVIGQDVLMASLGTMASGGGLLGQILLDQGAIDEKQRTDALRLQCLRKLIHTFALRAGAVEIVADEHDLGKNDGLGQVNVLELVRKGVSRHYDANRVREEMGPQYDAALATTTAFGRYRSHFQFRPDDDPALERLATGATVEALAELPGMSEARAAHLMFALWACQMLLPADQAPAQPAASTPAPKPAAPPPPEPAPPKPAASPEPKPEPKPAAPPPVAKKPEPKPKPAPASKPPEKVAASAEEEAAFVAEIEAFEGRIADDAHAFALLGLELSAEKKEVRRAWADLSRKFHPDTLQARGLTHLRNRVESVFAALSEAQMVLGDKEQREELRKLLEASGGRAKGSQDAAAMVRATIEAEMIAKEADKMLKAGRFPDALERYQRAFALTPDEPDLAAALAWCEFQAAGKPDDQVSPTIARLGEIAQEYPNVARAHYFRGLVLLHAGNDSLALGAFEEAHKANPRLIDAERQARAIKLRRNPPKKKEPKEQSSFLGRLFKK